MPKFYYNAQIKEEELEDYLLNVAEILRSYSGGYGIWTYRNYCSNMLYNAQFGLKDSGWDGRNIEFVQTNNSMACHLLPTGCIKQIIPDIRNHFKSDDYIFEFSVLEVNEPGAIEVQIGDILLETEVQNVGKVQLNLAQPICFDLNISSVNADIIIDNLKLFSLVQEGYLYDENGNELECIDSVRILNNMLLTN